jgi:hypothetical protein
MLGAGTVINPIIKIVTTVAVLAAAYFFIVKPVLDTTDNAIDKAGRGFENATQSANNAFDTAQASAAVSRADSYASSLQSTWPAGSREIKACLKHAAGRGTQAAERCADQGQTLVHSVQSDRSFSLSYADSLDAQGDSASAARIEACVKQAGFKPAAMDRCRNLADELLFG